MKDLGLLISSSGAQQMEGWRRTWYKLTSRGRGAQGKGGGTWILSSLDQVGPAKMEGNLDGAVETGTPSHLDGRMQDCA